MDRYAVGGRWDWIVGGAARRGIEEQGAAVGGEGEGGAGGGVSGFVDICTNEGGNMDIGLQGRRCGLIRYLYLYKE